MKFVKTITMIFLLGAAAPAFAEEGTVCRTFAGNMTQKVIAVFHDASKNEDQKRLALSALFQDAVDTDWIGKFVLGRFWREASPAELGEYLQSYRAYLTAVYISKFKDEDGMNVDDIKLVSVTPTHAPEYVAKTLVQNKGDDDVHVDYLLDESASKCHVHDIIVEGVSLLTSQRSEFSALATKSGVKGVITTLKQHGG